MWIALALSVALQPTLLHSTTASRCSAPPQMMAKGFGKTPKPDATPKKPPTPNAIKRDKAAQAFDELKSTGAPEYIVSVRTVPADGGAPSDWYPVGGIAVPRSSSEDTAVSMAIFNNEDDLLKGAYRTYPKLKVSTDKFEVRPAESQLPTCPPRPMSCATLTPLPLPSS